MDIINYENKEICSKCGGRCCKKSGCDYFISDFEKMETKYLEDFLNEGYASIVATLSLEQLSNGKKVITPILILRARNTNRDIIDLVSMKTRCMSLTDNGCSFDIEKRPSGGSTLIPRENLKCENSVDRLTELKKYLPYQKTLQRLVKKFTGVSYEAKLKMDIENLFYDILIGNFEGVDKIEIVEILDFIPKLTEVYPDLYESAKKRAIDDQKILNKKIS